jgi:hypothetical protein
MAGENSNTPDDDLFEAVLRERALAPPGEYPGQMVSASPFVTKRTQGHEVLIRVVEGRHEGRLLKLRLITDGPTSLDGMIGHNVALLESWWQEIGVKGRPSRRDSFDVVFRTLRANGRDKRLVFTIDIRGSGRFTENTLVGVRWDVL